MKNMKKLLALLLAVVLCLGMTTVAMATDTPTTAKITINNSAKGVTYTVYKLFGASVTGAEGGSIAYTGDIPTDLSNYFAKDSAGNISLKEAGGTPEAMSDALRTALTNWAKTATETTHKTGTGGTLEFTGLEFGYYVVTTAQGDQAITVTSTNPNATIVDKNETEPHFPDDGGKKVDNTDVSIGDTVTYTVTFVTSNFDGAGEDAKKISSYTVADTLPDFLSGTEVKSVVIKQTGKDDVTIIDADGKAPQFAGTDKAFTIEWLDENGNSKYDNGATVVVTYTATVTDKVEIGNAPTEENTNKVTISWKTKDGDEEEPGSKELTDEETINSYALAIQKVDETGKPLAGATFSIAGVEATGAKGEYTVTKQGESVTTPTVMECDDNGYLVLKGIASGDYTVTEVAAPAGYNKLADPKTVTASKIASMTSTTKTTVILDKDGNVVYTESTTTTTEERDVEELKAGQLVVVNNKGTNLPSTGGIGTTIFYVIGGILVVGAGVLLITKKRMSRNG